jgi:RNA polymerase sigma-70 factor, ECF subfamily
VDEATLREFVRTTYPRLVAAVTLISGSRAAAEDAVQEALTRAWERSRDGERIDSLPAWVTTVSVNLARSGVRRLLAERRARAAVATRPPPPDRIEERIDLRAALLRLPRRQREAIVLHYYLGLDVRDVAHAMRAPEGTVKSLLARGRGALARSLGDNDLEEIRER